MLKVRMLWIGMTTVLLTGCSSIPEMTSHDGSTFALKRNIITYTRPGSPATTCEFTEVSKLWVCDNGTTSTLLTARLPLSFHGIVLVEFDGKTFTNPKLLGG